MNPQFGRLKPKQAQLPNITRSQDQSYRIGDVAYFDRAPNISWVPANGRVVSGNVYPELAKLILPERGPNNTVCSVTGSVPSSSVINAVAISPDGLHAAVAQNGGTIYFYNIVNDVVTFTGSHFTGNAITGLFYSPDSQALLVTSSTTGNYLTCYVKNGANYNNTTTSITGALPSSNINNMVWVDNDLVLFFTGATCTPYTKSGNAYSVQTALAGGSFSQAPVDISVSEDRQYILFSSGPTGVGLTMYRRNGSTVVPAGITMPVLTGVFKVRLLGSSNNLHTIIAYSSNLYIYHLDPLTNTYYQRQVKAISDTGNNSSATFACEPAKGYVYAGGNVANAFAGIFKYDTGRVTPVALLTATNFPNNLGSFDLLSLSNDGKYMVARTTGVSPYFSVYRESPVINIITLPDMPEKVVNGKKMIAYVKAKP